MTCSAVESAADVVIVSKVSGDADTEVTVDAVASGSFDVKLHNHGSAADTTALVYNYVVIHGANS